MRSFLTILVLALGISFALPASLSGKDRKRKRGKEKVTEFNFEEDEVTVSFLKPEVGFVGLLQQEKASSLIKIRQDFVDEIVRSAEDL